MIKFIDIIEQNAVDFQDDELSHICSTGQIIDTLNIIGHSIEDDYYTVEFSLPDDEDQKSCSFSNFSEIDDKMVVKFKSSDIHKLPHELVCKSLFGVESGRSFMSVDNQRVGDNTDQLTPDFISLVESILVICEIKTTYDSSKLEELYNSARDKYRHALDVRLRSKTIGSGRVFPVVVCGNELLHSMSGISEVHVNTIVQSNHVGRQILRYLSEKGIDTMTGEHSKEERDDFIESLSRLKLEENLKLPLISSVTMNEWSDAVITNEEKVTLLNDLVKSSSKTYISLHEDTDRARISQIESIRDPEGVELRRDMKAIVQFPFVTSILNDEPASFKSYT